MPASSARRRRLLAALVWFHRWLGVFTCLIYAAWFASGAVMLFHPFPSLSRAMQMALEARVDARAIAIAPAQAIASAGGGAGGLKLVQRAGRAAYLIDNGGHVQAIDAISGTRLPLLAREAATAEAHRLFGTDGTANGPFDYDQWVVHNRFDPARPFYRLDAGDTARTRLYLSARTGELLQRTTWSERTWSWPGAVLHWVYMTPLRKNWSAWDNTVWWLSLTCMLVAVTGTILGVVRMLAARRLQPPRISFYRAPWTRWHHLTGLASAIFVLSWIFSGWLSMDHGRLFSRGMPTALQARRYAGCPLAEALRRVPLSGIRMAASGATELGFTQLSCEAVLTRYAPDGKVARFRRDARALSSEDLRALVGKSARAAWPATSLVCIAAVDPAATYALAEGWPASAWQVKLGAAALPDLYVDGANGRLLTVMDESRAAYDWVYYALHTGNVPGLTTRPELRRALVLVPLIAGFLFSITGVVLGWRRLRQSLRAT